MSAKVITVTNQKGGVTKTTSCTMLAVGLARLGFKVLVIDADSQGNTSALLHAQKSSPTTPRLADLLLYVDVMDDDGTTRKIRPEDAIQHTEYCDVIASDHRTGSTVDSMPAEDVLFFIPDLVDAVRENYDFIILDTGCANTRLVKSALIGSDGVIIPIILQELALDGLELTHQTLVQARKPRYNPRLKLYGILIAQYDARESRSRTMPAVIEEYAKIMGTKVFRTIIRTDANVGNSHSAEVPEEMMTSPDQIGVILYDYAPKSRAATDYAGFIEELLNDLEMEVPNNGDSE